MASKPTEKGKRPKLYNDSAGTTDKPTFDGSEEGRATTSRVATASVHPDWMTLRSGTRIEQKGITETSLGLTIETTDGAVTTSAEGVAKTEDTRTSGRHLGRPGMKAEEVEGKDLPQKRMEGDDQTPKEEIYRGSIRRRMVAEKKDEMLQHVIRPLARRLRDLGPDPGYTPEKWMDCLQHLSVPSVYRGDDPILETLRRSEPPLGHDKMSWVSFVNGIEEELKAVLEEATTRPEENKQANPIVGSTPSTPDTLRLAEQSLLMPKQEDESNSAVERRMNAARRMKNPPRTDNEATSTSSRMSITKEEVLEEHKDRVVHQRIRNSEIRDIRESMVLGQGIVFDGKGKPRDIRPGQKLRREGIGTTGGRGRTESLRKRPPEGGREDSDGSSYSDDEEEGGGSGPPMDNEEEVEGAILVEGATRRSKDRQRSRSRNYNIPYQRSHTAELEVYKDRGAPRMTKYLRAIHNKFHHIINEYLGDRIENLSGVKTPKVPEPKAYRGEGDAEVFDKWLVGLLRWFRVNRYCGMEFDKERVVCTALYLEDTTITWYDDNVDGMDHQNDVWSFKMVITRLYDRFIHHVSVGATADKFWNEIYIPEEGIMAFYHKLTRHASRMVRPPDRYTFKSHLVTRMPGPMFNYLLSKEVTAEYSTVEERKAMGGGQQEMKPERKPFRKYNETFSLNQRYEVKQTVPSANTMGTGSRRREPEKGTTGTRTKEPDKRSGPHKGGKNRRRRLFQVRSEGSQEKGPQMS
jgi:hypothetical protein